ncbi:2,4-dihydroxyhept-2-ene-1,7-dioic acid aldolase [Cryptococcus neoformans]|nr:2,4-dihydroxyhept-2-ene-1,7-dioic acid aldolase [Cryptococcus neoformans var. grubii]OXC66957.1 2,4-dihydroxyhept-2-ene-1,7-dioic acid aldolase [Cryptococcus neoformans var. grubii MW-RSA852]
MSTITNGITVHVPRHRLRNGLEAGKPMIGCFSSLPSAWTARIVASCGWDYVIIDCEHGNHDDSDMHDTVNVIASENVSPIVRLRAGEYGLIKRALDCGAHGIMVPMVNTPEDARNIVKWSKFPPMGVRGQGSSFSAMASGLTTHQYVSLANKTILTIVQIETPEAVSNAEEIASIEGVDALFIGPNDLALSLLGYVPARWDEPEFLDALEKVRSAAKKYGKYAGILARNGTHAKELSEKWTLVGLGSDVRALQTAMKATVAASRSEV